MSIYTALCYKIPRTHRAEYELTAYMDSLNRILFRNKLAYPNGCNLFEQMTFNYYNVLASKLKLQHLIPQFDAIMPHGMSVVTKPVTPLCLTNTFDVRYDDAWLYLSISVVSERHDTFETIESSIARNVTRTYLQPLSAVELHVAIQDIQTTPINVLDTTQRLVRDNYASQSLYDVYKPQAKQIL